MVFAMVFGFPWLAEKVMNKRRSKEQGIKLIVVKVEIVENGDNKTHP